MNEHVKDIPENGEIEVAIFKNGRSRAVRIPKEIEFDGAKAIFGEAA
ncbi:AbrB/MazE/SpoVT family DNA-binding domain-containing protein [Rhizobium sp. AN80A]|nr:AbrB/MazE/SpoVT family DNA-binding domain-containing protein [Rhizobium sp. AN80A]